MTKSMEMSTQSFQRMGQMHQPWQNTKKISEQPVLDLSCKKVSMDKVSSECGVDFSITKFRHSPELQKEKNNNNEVNSYNVNNMQQIQATQMYQQQTSNNFVALNHERNSPENRSFVITPPSETESPLKMGYQPVYSHAGPMPNEVQKQPLFPILPIKVPVHSSVSVPPMLPAIIPQSTSQPIISPVPQTQIPSLAALPESSPTSVSSDDSKRNPRPFKAYPKDPLSLSFGPEMIFDPDMKKSYSDFRSRMLESVRKTNEGTNIKMRRISKSPTLPAHPSDEKDAAYWERRRKNNEAAKRSRDARRAKEDEIAIRAAFLEQEYIRLKYENALLKDENTKFKCMIYGH